MTNTWRVLYGAVDGRWLLVEGPIDIVAAPSVGVIVPSSVGGYGQTRILAYLGEPREVITRVHARLTGAHPTIALAKMLQVREGSVRRYLAGSQSPTLPPAGWSNLVRAYIDGDVPA